MTATSTASASPASCVPERVPATELSKALGHTDSCIYYRVRKGLLPPFDVMGYRTRGKSGFAAYHLAKTLEDADPTIYRKVVAYYAAKKS